MCSLASLSADRRSIDVRRRPHAIIGQLSEEHVDRLSLLYLVLSGVELGSVPAADSGKWACAPSRGTKAGPDRAAESSLVSNALSNNPHCFLYSSGTKQGFPWTRKTVAQASTSPRRITAARDWTLMASARPSLQARSLSCLSARRRRFTTPAARPWRH